MAENKYLKGGLREKRIYLEQIISKLRFWTYLPALKKWVKNCDSLTCIDHYENMVFEAALIAAAREAVANQGKVK